MEQAVELLEGLPPALIYVLLGVGAAVENLLPVIPADTFIVIGGFLAGVEAISPAGIFLTVWGANAGGAVLVYWAGLRYGPTFFKTGPGRHLMSEYQIERLDAFYDRWGVIAIFLARFLPGFRAVVPVFAGVTGQGALRVVPPLLVASAIWYGALVWIGYVAGENLEEVVDAVARTNRGLLVVSLLLAVLLAVVWFRVRRRAASGARCRAREKQRQKQ